MADVPSRRARGAALALALLLLAGCAAKPIEPPPPPAPPAGIDGRYRGTARLVRSDNRYCPRSGPRVHEVQNGVLTLSYQGPGRERVPLTAPIKPNGDFDFSDGEGRLQGHIGNGALSLTIVSQACEHHWTMRLID